MSPQALVTPTPQPLAPIPRARASSLLTITAVAGLAITLAAALSACSAESPSRAPDPSNRPRSASAATTSAAPTVLPTPAPRVLSIEPWTYDGVPGQTLRTTSYTLWTTSDNRAITDRLPIFMERALNHYTAALGPLPRPGASMDTYLFANRPQWARMTQRVMGQDAAPYLQIERGGFSARGQAVFFDIGTRDTFAIAAHEGWHQYTQTTFRVPLPVWLEEGVATYMEGFRWQNPDAATGSTAAPSSDQRRSRNSSGFYPQGPDAIPRFLPWYNWERFVYLTRAARANRLMPLEQLVATVPQDLVDRGPDAALLYYAQVWALTLYLAEGEGGSMRPNLEQLLRDAASGEMAAKVSRAVGDRAGRSTLSRRRGDALLRTYFAMDAAAMQPGYSAFVQAIARPGARQWIAQGVSPVDNAPPAPPAPPAAPAPASAP
jgi:hypothetical protein